MHSMYRCAQITNKIREGEWWNPYTQKNLPWLSAGGLAEKASGWVMKGTRFLPLTQTRMVLLGKKDKKSLLNKAS